MKIVGEIGIHIYNYVMWEGREWLDVDCLNQRTTTSTHQCESGSRYKHHQHGTDDDWGI